MMKKEDLRIVFMGTPEFAVGTLQALVEGGYRVVAVVTQPDKAVGRHHDTLQPSEVKKYAQACGLPVLQPEKMKDPSFLAELQAFRPDLQVVAAFRMLPEQVWAMPRFGTFNVHAALLPQYRGAAPINWAIINGETRTGVTTFFLDHQIDTGRIILQRPFDIPDDADAEYVYDGLMRLGAEAALETVDAVLAGDGHVDSVSQTDWMAGKEMELKAAPKIFKETCQIDFHQSAKQVYDFIRGLSPYPGAWMSASLKDGTERVLKIYRSAKTDDRPVAQDTEAGTLQTEKNRLFVACRDSWLELLSVQLSGSRRMNVKDFLNGNRNLF